MNFKKITIFALTGILMASVPAFAHQEYETGNSRRSGSVQQGTVCASQSKAEASGYSNMNKNRLDHENDGKRNGKENERGTDFQNYGKAERLRKNMKSTGQNLYENKESYGLRENFKNQANVGRGKNRMESENGNSSHDIAEKSHVGHYGQKGENSNKGMNSKNGEGRRMKDGNREALRDGSGTGEGNKDGFHRNR